MASQWSDTEKANDNGGDGWEAAAEQMQDWQQWETDSKQWQQTGTDSKQCDYYLQLSDVVDSQENVIWWVDTIEGLVDATSYFSSPEVKVVGIDCEWKPNYVRGNDPNQVSILQIATGKKVLIFDLIGLFERESNVLDTCLKVVFHSARILKLGYGFQQDLEHLFESYADLECFHFCDGILDLQKLYGPKGGLSGLAKTLLGSELNKDRRMSNWERRPLTHSQLRYAALDAAVLVAIFNVVCNEASSHGSSGTQDMSHWKSLVKCCTADAIQKRNSVIPEADSAGAAIGELADNQIMYEIQDFRINGRTVGPRSVGAKWQSQRKPVSQATSTKAKGVEMLGPDGGCWNCGGDHYKNNCPNNPDTTTKQTTRIYTAATSSKAKGVGKLGPDGGCWNCGGDHYKNNCPNNPDTTTKQTTRIYTAANRCEADNQASPVELKDTSSGRGRRNTPWSTRNPRKGQYTTTKQNYATR